MSAQWMTSFVILIIIITLHVNTMCSMNQTPELRTDTKRHVCLINDHRRKCSIFAMKYNISFKCVYEHILFNLLSLHPLLGEIYHK